MAKRNLTWHKANITKQNRSGQKKQKSCLIWFTGLSGSGKSTLANALECELFKQGFHTYLLDGDNVRYGLNKDLGFSDKDRQENIRRIAEVAKLFVDAGLIVISAFISPFKTEREMAKKLLGEGEFVEVYVSTSLEACEERDPKGLYKKARSGEIINFTGVDSEYDIPKSPDLNFNTEYVTVELCVLELINFLKVSGKIGSEC